MKREEDSCQLILYSSNARTKAMEAISNAKKGNVVLANDNLKNAKDELLIAQKKHAELLRDMANEEDVETNLLMIHAEDHVFGAQNTLEMANEIVELYGRLKEYE